MAANDTHTEIMKGAMMLFSKQNCNPGKHMFLNTMNRRLSDPWDALTANENNIYMSELTYFHNDCEVISLFIPSISL
jgi:hypothetical protein